MVTLALILPWRENYGSNTESDKEKSESNGQSTSLLVSMKETLHVILSEPAVLCLGLSQALFEGGMFTFGELSIDLTAYQPIIWLAHDHELLLIDK